MTPENGEAAAALHHDGPASDKTNGCSTSIVSPDVDPERVAEARAWFAEFLGDLGGVHDHGAAWLATSGDGWHEAGPFTTDMADDLSQSLAASAVLTADTGADVFACPYPQTRGGRKKGRAVLRRHVHADIDGAIDLAHARCLGAMVVASGSPVSGAPDAVRGHVYVRLTESVPAYVHEALCRALGQAVGGSAWDATKCADNDVLRPAGTLNHKAAMPVPVRWVVSPSASEVVTWAPGDLAAMLGVSWPIPEPSTTLDALPAPALVQLDEGAPVAARVAGLVRHVADAEPHAGNEALNWAAGKCGALAATHPDEIDADEIRARLVEAYVSRPTSETAAARRREAEQTVASGWRYGEADPAAVLGQGVRGAERRQELQTDKPGPGAEPMAELVEIIDEETEEVTATAPRERPAEEEEAPRQTCTRYGQFGHNPRACAQCRLDEADGAEEFARRQAEAQARLFARAVGNELTPEEEASILGRFKLFDADALRNRRPAPDIVAGVIGPVGSLNEIDGHRGSMKTLVTLGLAAAVGVGMPTVYGLPVTLHAPVLYVYREGVDGLPRRTVAWEFHHGRHMDGVTFVHTPVDLKKPADVQALAILTRKLGAAMVVLDSVAKTGGGKEDAEDFGAYRAGLEALRDASGAAVVVVHNSGHNETRGRGHTTLIDAMDSAVLLRKRPDSKGGGVELVDEKSRDSASVESLVLRFQPEGPVNRATGKTYSGVAVVQAYGESLATALEEANRAERELVVFLGQCAEPGRATSAELARHLGVTTKNLARAVKNNPACTWVQAVGQGRATRYVYRSPVEDGIRTPPEGLEGSEEDENTPQNHLLESPPEAISHEEIPDE